MRKSVLCERVRGGKSASCVFVEPKRSSGGPIENLVYSETASLCSVVALFNEGWCTVDRPALSLAWREPLCSRALP